MLNSTKFLYILYFVKTPFSYENSKADNYPGNDTVTYKVNKGQTRVLCKVVPVSFTYVTTDNVTLNDATAHRLWGQRQRLHNAT